MHPVLAFLFGLAAVVLFVLAGCGVRRRYFVPEWWAAACLTVALVLGPLLPLVR